MVTLLRHTLIVLLTFVTINNNLNGSPIDSPPTSLDEESFFKRKRLMKNKHGGKYDENESRRIQKIKDDILLKLGLDKIPNNTISKENIPSALLADSFYKPEPRPHENETEEEVIKKKTIILGHVESMSKYGTKNCMMVTFNEESASDVNVLSIELWVYRKVVNKGKSSHYSVFTSNKHGKHLLHASRIFEKQSGWFATELKVKRILKISEKGEHFVKFQAKMECENCMFSKHSKEQPFISLKTIKKIKRRVRRSTSEKCSSTSSCCRNSLTVDFKAIGWDGWVISPLTYDAYYCKGDCSGNDNSYEYQHTGVIKAVVKKVNHKDIPLCCTPKRFSSLSMLYMSDGNIIRREIENMRVEECWCI